MRRLRRLVAKRSLRWSEGVCVLEGSDLIDAALGAEREFEGIYVDASRAGDPDMRGTLARARSAGVRVVELSPGVLERVADAQTPQGLIAAVRFREQNLASLDARGTVVVLHDVRDPGNAGAVIRTADAAGASAVVLSGQCVDPYNPKTLRATAGSIFHVPVVLAAELSEVTSWFARGGGASYATVVRGGRSYLDLDLSGDALIVLGNEGEGLSSSDVDACDATMSIPMSGHNESLNVAVAAGVILFASLAQRTRAGQRTTGPSITTP